MSERRALVVDDNPALAGVVEFNLQQAGFIVDVAHDGQEGFQCALGNSYDVVVTDHQMPELTGVQLCRKLREIPSYRRTPLILLTAKELELDIVTLTEELALAATISKPFSPNGLIQTVQQCVAEAGELDAHAARQ